MYIITDNKYNIDPNKLFCIGKRDMNNKRSFLFISKLLGKHISVDPNVVRATGYLLSSLKYDFSNTSFISCIKEGTEPNYNCHAMDNGVLVIGFCETATGLGMAVASSIKGAYYQTTTREPIKDIPQLLSFEESHSHASTHYMFSDDFCIKKFGKIILVDDEITTGNSLLHLMEEIIKQGNVREISIMTILDWRNEEQKKQFQSFAKENSIDINVYSLLSGYLKNEDKNLYRNSNVTNISERTSVISLNIFERRIVSTIDGTKISYIEKSGRFGVLYKDIDAIEEYAQSTAKKIANLIGLIKNILILGHGENIYIPSRIASYLKRMGYDVRFRTTSRTPIFCDGKIIKDVVTFIDRGVTYHFYNKSEAEEQDKVIMLTETPLNYLLSSNMLVFEL